MTRFAFFEGEIRPIDDAKISVMTQSFNYGTACFGGIRGYWNDAHGQLYVFRIQDHYRRFLNSGKILMANIPYSAQDLAAITLELLVTEGWRQNCYVRPLIYKADEIIGVRLDRLRDAVTIFSVAMENYLPREAGLKLCTSSWRRVDDTMIPPRGKISGAYFNSALAVTEAHLNGFDDAIVLNQDGHIAEASAANLVMVRHGKLVTPPATDNSLEGITLNSVLHLAQHELGLEVEAREIDRTEMYYAEEAFLCGTGAQVVSIASLDHRAVGSTEMGPITKAIRDLFRVVRGEEENYMHWLTPGVTGHPGLITGAMNMSTFGLKDSVQSQFNQAAANYTTSPIHASGPDLLEMVKAAQLVGNEHLLDAGCGTGHTALTFVPHVAQVVALDLAESMLAQARNLAVERSITNIDFRRGDVERLPFADNSFDVVTTRLSAHHWPHPLNALCEFHRVLRPSGRLLVDDIVSSDDYVVDTHFQAIELLRDPSHVRDHTVQEWLDLLDQAGFESEIAHRWEVAIDFTSWIQRINTPPQHAAMIRTLLADAPSEVKSALKLQSDTTFTMQAALLRGLPRR